MYELQCPAYSDMHCARTRLVPPAGLHDTGVDMTVAEKLYGFPSVYVVTMNSPARASPVIHRLQVTELHAVMTEGAYGRSQMAALAACG